MPVTCVARAFYAEFDDVKGPVVLYEEPPGCLTRDEEGRRIWECFGDYVITGREPLDGVAVRARAGRDAVLCVPQILRSETRYVRNALLFGLGVAVPGADLPAATGACLPALQRLSRSLRALEAEAQDASWAARKERLEAALPAVLEALERAAAQACRRHVPPAPPTPWPATRDPNVLALARPWLSRRNAKASVVHGGLDERRPPPAVEPYEVPILLARPRDLLRLSSHRYGDDAWDLAVQQVIPHVDGVRSAKQLARAARVDLDVVLRSLRVLRHYRCLAVVDTFQYQNVYRATDRLSRLAASRRALEGCARFCFRGEARKGLQGLDALRLYCAFQDARSVKDVLLEAARAAPKVVAALDVRAFVAFGLVHGLLVRVHRFPVAVRAAQPSRARTPPPPFLDRLVFLCDGSRRMDAVCTDVDLPAARCDAELREHGYATIDVYR